jgi:hypothetical protein
MQRLVEILHKVQGAIGEPGRSEAPVGTVVLPGPGTELFGLGRGAS